MSAFFHSMMASPRSLRMYFSISTMRLPSYTFWAISSRASS